MSGKIQGGVKGGSTSLSFSFVLRKSFDGTEQTGKAAADLTMSYWRHGGVRVAVNPVNLASVNSAFVTGGVKEVDATNMPGLYRVDWPDDAFVESSPGGEWVQVCVNCAGCFSYYERIPLSSMPGANDNADALLDRSSGVETTQTVRQTLRLMLSALCGKASGLETTSVIFRNPPDTKNRIAATVDANGNRTAVTLDASD